MPELLPTLDALGRAAPTWLLAMTLWTLGLWLCARTLDALLRRRLAAAWRLPLYGVVLARLVLPVDWQSPIVAWPMTEDDVAVATVVVDSALVPPPAPTLIGASARLEAPAPAPAPGVPWGLAVLLTWACGAALLLARQALHRRRLRAVAGSGQPASAVARRSVPARVRVIVHPQRGPLAFGVRSPTIVLPRALLSAGPAALRCVLAHELAHLERRDPVTVGALAVVVALAWPVLPVWLAARRIRALLELAADERAVAARGGRWREYGRVMIELAAGGVREPALSIGLFGHVRERVAALRPRSRPRPALQALVGLSLPGVAFACAGLPDAQLAERCERRAAALAELPDDALEERAAALDALTRRFEDAQAGDAMTAACHDATREALAAAAKDWHDRAERAGDDSLRARASDAYARFTALFPDDPEANELRYFHGELLWARATDALHRGASSSELFLRSRQEFVEVLERDPGGAHTQDAAYGQLLAARSALGEPGPAPAVKGLGAVPYGAAAQELVDGYRRYLELGPARGLEVGRAAHGWASLAMRHNHFTEARPLLERAIDELDGADETRALAVQSAEMLVDVLTIAWTGEGQTTAAKAASAEALETGLKELAERALWEHPDADRLRAAAATLSASLAWKRAAALYEAGEYRACGEAYTALAEAHPEPARREELRANAAACFAEVADGG